MSAKYELLSGNLLVMSIERGAAGVKDLKVKMTDEQLQRTKGQHLHGYKNLEGKRLVIKGRKNLS